MSGNEHISYEQSGVNYSELDPFKIAAQEAGAATAHNLERFGYHEIPKSRGESAYVWDEGDKYGAIVTEGLGTKNLVADEMRKITDETYYDFVAQDTVAMIVNDLIVVGAMPKVVTAHFSVAESNWFNDTKRTKDLIEGWTEACEYAGAVWGPGETPAIKGILQPGTIELSGSAVGEINPKDRLTLGDKLQPGDDILFLRSNGIHANGLTLARAVADRLPNGYATQLSDGSLYGEALLSPTFIYVDAVRSLFEAGVDIHYMVNITGHGWRKLMRADRELTYIITQTAEPYPEFDLIQEITGNSDEEMYSNFNMGAGFAVFVNSIHTRLALEELQLKCYSAWLAGNVKEGPKQVIVGPKNIVFKGSSLNLRRKGLD